MQFSQRAQQMLALTNHEAQNLGHDHVSSEHFLLGALALGEGIGPSSLANAGLRRKELRSHLVAVGPTLEPVSHSYGYSAHRIFAAAIRYADGFGRAEVEPEDVILAILDETDSGAPKALARYGVDTAAIRRSLGLTNRRTE